MLIRFRYIAALGVAIAAAHAAEVEWRPEKNIEIISAVAAGGGADATARMLQRMLQERLLGVSAAVVNKPGGGQTIAMSYLNQHSGDGHYIAVASTPLVSNYITGTSSQHYRDFTPLALLLTEHVAIVVKVDSPLKSAKEVIERLKKDPGSLSIAIGSTLGGINHIAIGLALYASGVEIKKLKAVVFPSSGAATTAVLGGHVDVAAALINIVVPQVEAGRMRVLAVSAPQRVGGALASAPTWKEHGIDAIAANWRIVIGSKGLNAAQVGFWDSTLAKVTNAVEWKVDLQRNFQQWMYLNSAGTSEFLDAQNKQFKAVLSRLGLSK